MTEQTDATPEWMTPGTEVIYSSGGASGRTMHKVTIEKVTKTTIVAGGTRYRRVGLTKVGASTWDSGRLLDPTDPRTGIAWLEYQQKQLRSNLQYEIDKLLRDFGRSGDVALAEQARDKIADAISRFKTREAKIERLTAKAN